MYRLPAGNGGTVALFKIDPTPTLLSEEPSYTQTRDVTGVVPSGNSRGSSAVIATTERKMSCVSQKVLIIMRE